MMIRTLLETRSKFINVSFFPETPRLILYRQYRAAKENRSDYRSDFYSE